MLCCSPWPRASSAGSGGDHRVAAIILLVGLAAVSMLPGLWTRPRTIEGIAGAAGIGLGATAVFLLVDVMLLQNIGTYSQPLVRHRRREQLVVPPGLVDGGHVPPLDGRLDSGQPDRPQRTAIGSGWSFRTVVWRVVIGAAAASCSGFPGPAGTLGTFAVAFLPGLALATLVSVMGSAAPEPMRWVRCSFVSSDGCSRLFWRGQLHFSERSGGRCSP